MGDTEIVSEVVEVETAGEVMAKKRSAVQLAVPEAMRVDLDVSRGGLRRVKRKGGVPRSDKRAVGRMEKDELLAKHELDMKFMRDVAEKFTEEDRVACWSPACGEAKEGCLMAMQTLPK